VNVRAFHGVESIHSNLEIVRRLFECFAEGGIEAALPGMDERLVIEIPPDMSAEPDIYHGHEGARRYFAGFDGMLEDVRYEPVELIAVGDRVLAHARMSGRGVSSGLDVELEAFVVHELAGGKITRMRPYPDMESAKGAAEG
jgi:ketosteroid isomerase-like protein